MKMRYFYLVVCVMLINSKIFSQESSLINVEFKTFKGGAVNRENKIYIIEKNGVLTPLDKETFDISKEITIKKNGEVKFDDGSKLKIKDGELITKEGNLVLLADRYTKLEGYIIRDAKTFKVQGNKAIEVKEFDDLGDGLGISKSGEVVKSDLRFTLSEGEILSFTGDILKWKTGLVSENGIMLRNNIPMRYEGKKFFVVDKEYDMAGVKISPQGVITMKDGSKFSLKEGEFLSEKGELLMSKSDHLTDCFTKRDGKVLLLKDGIAKSLSDEYKFADGSSVQPNGLVTVSDTNKLMLRDGDILTMSGDLLMTKSANLDNQGRKLRLVEDHFIFRDGKVLMVKDGEPTLLSKEIVLPNGSKVFKHGHIYLADGSKYMMNDGDKITMAGEIQKKEIKTIPTSYFTLKKGKFYWVNKDGKPTLISETQIIEGQTKVSPLGEILAKSGLKVQIKENEMLGLDALPIKVMKIASPSTTTTSGNVFVAMKEGKVYVIKNGKPSLVTENTIVDGKLKLTVQGVAISKTGKKAVLKDGDVINLDAGPGTSEILSKINSIDSKKTEIPISSSNYVTLINGKVFQIKDGKNIPIEKNTILEGVLKVSADGTIFTKGGKKILLKESMKVGLNGEEIAK